MIALYAVMMILACAPLGSQGQAAVLSITEGKQLKTASDFVGPNCICASTTNFLLANCSAPVQLTITPKDNDFEATYECPADGQKLVTKLKLDGNHTDEILPNGVELDIYAWLNEQQGCGLAFKVGESAATQVEIILPGVCEPEKCQTAFTKCQGEAEYVVATLGASGAVQKIGA